MAEQRYQAVVAVIGKDLSIRQVAEKVGVSRQTLHPFSVRYEAQIRGTRGLAAPAGALPASDGRPVRWIHTTRS